MSAYTPALLLDMGCNMNIVCGDISKKPAYLSKYMTNTAGKTKIIEDYKKHHPDTILTDVTYHLLARNVALTEAVMTLLGIPIFHMSPAVHYVST